MLVIVGIFMVTVGSPLLAQEKLRIFWNTGHKYDTYVEIFEQFEKEFNVKLEIEYLFWPAMRPKLLAQFMSGNPPDLLESHSAWPIEFSLLGFLQNLDPYISQWNQYTDWVEGAKTMTSYQGSTYGIKMQHTTFGLFYNKQMFEDMALVSVPQTWTELLVAAQKLTRDTDGDGKADVWGFGVHNQLQFFWPWLVPGGAELMNEEGTRVALDSADALRTGRFFQDLIYKHKVTLLMAPGAKADFQRKAFASEKIGMMYSGPWAISVIKKMNPGMSYGIAEIPRPEGYPKRNITRGVSLVIPKASKYPDLAWELIKRLVEVEVEVKVTSEAGQLFPRKSWAAHPEIAKIEVIQPFIEGLKYAVPYVDKLRRVAAEKWALKVVEDMAQAMYESILYNVMPAEKALKQYTEEANKILGLE